MISFRTFALAALITFSFAPLAVAQTTSGPPATTGGATTSGPPAQTTTPAPYVGDGSTVTLMNPLGQGATLNSLLESVLQFVVRIGAIVVILMLVWIGFLFVTAQGNDSKLTEAKNALMWTVIGALILLGAEAIAQGIQATVTALSTGG